MEGRGKAAERSRKGSGKVKERAVKTRGGKAAERSRKGTERGSRYFRGRHRVVKAAVEERPSENGGKPKGSEDASGRPRKRHRPVVVVIVAVPAARHPQRGRLSVDPARRLPARIRGDYSH